MQFAELTGDGKTLIALAGHELRGFAADTLQARYPPLALRANPQFLALGRAGSGAILGFNENDATGFHERLESYDAASGKLLVGNASVRAPLRQFELSPDATRLFSVGPATDATRVFDAATLRRIGEYPHDPTQPVLWASFTSDSKQLWLLTRAVDETLAESAELIRWNPETGGG